mgnify:CR=1 FL=1
MCVYRECICVKLTQYMCIPVFELCSAIFPNQTIYLIDVLVIKGCKSFLKLYHLRPFITGMSWYSFLINFGRTLGSLTILNTGIPYVSMYYVSYISLCVIFVEEACVHVLPSNSHVWAPAGTFPRNNYLSVCFFPLLNSKQM